MSLAADEIALLVYRYLHESGFDHSAFTFGHESLLAHTDAVDCDLPYGSLIGLLQKGLQYLEIEKHVQADGSEAPHDASTTMMFDALRDSGGDSGTHSIVGADASSKLLESSPSSQALCCSYSPDGQSLAVGSAAGIVNMWSALDTAPVHTSIGIVESPQPAETAASSSSSSASASSSVVADEHHILSMEWAGTGSCVAVGSSSGHVAVLGQGAGTGCLYRGQPHSAAVFAVRFSPQATRLASCSLDGTVAVLDTEADDDDDSSDNGDDNQAADTKTGACYKQLATLASHRAPILDLAWQSETVFASCSTDKTVQISRLGSERPPKVLTGHASEVNCLCWDASRAVLASGSDDSTVKLWSTRDGQLASYAGHTGPVHRLCWGPSAGAGAGSGPFAPLIVSSGADGTSRVWDVNTGACRYTLEGHSAAVASARMSPDGAMLATASLDRRVLVWSLAEGRLLHTFENASAGALDVAWHVGGQTLAAAYTDGTAAVLQLRKQGVSEV